MSDKLGRVIYAPVQADSISRTTYRGEPWAIIKSVALVEGVHRGGSSKGPELVTRAVLEASLPSWNGRPVCVNHPANGGLVCEDPMTYEESAIGVLFNTRVEGPKLKTELWIDLARAEELGGITKATVEDLLDGDMREISVGMLAYAVAEEGEFKGKAYSYRLTEVFGDHVAVLQDGHRGACSIAEGCGAGRVYRAAGEEKGMKESTVMEQAALVKLLFRSDMELKEALAAAMSSVGIKGDIVAVFDEEGKFVYRTFRPGSEDMFGDFIFAQRAFSISEDDVITLGETVTEVRPKMDFTPVIVETSTTMDAKEEEDVAKDCLCEARKSVRELIELEASPYTVEDAEALNKLSDEKISTIYQSFQPKVEEEPASPEPKAPEETAEQRQFREYQEDQFRAFQAEKSRLISVVLKASSEFTEEELTEKGVKELRRLARLAKPADYSGLMPQEGDGWAENDEGGEAPPSKAPTMKQAYSWEKPKTEAVN